MIRWYLFIGLIAYLADAALFGGVHADAVIVLARSIGRGIALGMLNNL